MTSALAIMLYLAMFMCLLHENFAQDEILELNKGYGV
jgi:hypothetical protein